MIYKCFIWYIHDIFNVICTLQILSTKFGGKSEEKKCSAAAVVELAFYNSECYQ